jgi:hypothetical protein
MTNEMAAPACELKRNAAPSSPPGLTWRSMRGVARKAEQSTKMLVVLMVGMDAWVKPGHDA